MGQSVKFMIMNDDPEFGGELRAMLLQHEGVKIVAEVEESALLPQAIEQFPVDVVLVNLDPTPDAILPIVREVHKLREHLAVFATSESSDGQLILRAMRAGVQEFLPRPIENSALEEAISKVNVSRSESATQGKLISIIGTAGGVGTTVITTNLAVELAELVSGSVAVVDLDYRFGQVATLLDAAPKYTLADLCGSPEALEPQVILRAMTDHPTGVKILARPCQLAESDTITAAATMGVLSNLVQMNDHVVVDGPTRHDSGGKSVLALADTVLLVVQQLVPCIRNAARIIESMREDGLNMDRAFLVFNRVGRSSGQLSIDDITETLGLESFANIPDDWDTVSGAINLGEPLAQYSPKSKVRIALQEIAERLNGGTDGADEKEARKPGLMVRIFAGG